MPDAFPDLGPIRFRQHRDAGDVLNATVALLRQNARELAVSYLAVVAPVALAAGVAAGLYMVQVSDLVTDPGALEADPLGIFNVTYLGVILFGLLGSALTTAAVAAYVRLYREGRAGEITAGELWEEAKGLVLPFVGLSLAYGAVIGLSMVVIVVPCLGAIAWLAFFVWTIPYYAVTVATRALESPSLGEAWQRSRELVKGSWGFAFGALLLAVVVFYVFILIVSIPLYVVVALVGINSVGGDPGAAFSMMGIVFAPLQVVSYAGYLLPLLAVFFVHGRLVEDLEGTGLYEDLDALADAGGFDAPRSTPPAPEPPPPASPSPEADGPDDDAGDGSDAPGGFRGGGFRA